MPDPIPNPKAGVEPSVPSLPITLTGCLHSALRSTRLSGNKHSENFKVQKKQDIIIIIIFVDPQMWVLSFL